MPEVRISLSKADMHMRDARSHVLDILSQWVVLHFHSGQHKQGPVQYQYCVSMKGEKALRVHTK